MEWHIKTIAQKSSLSGEWFNSGDHVISLIYKDKQEGELVRLDLRPEEIEKFEIPGEVLGRWARIITNPEDEIPNSRETIASAEDFFFSLFEGEKKEPNEESDMLKHLLSLMLERKRVLRPIGDRKKSGEQCYRRIKTNNEINVPICNISTDLMTKIEDTIGDIIQ